jgi:hypothetical protein
MQKLNDEIRNQHITVPELCKRIRALFGNAVLVDITKSLQATERSRNSAIHKASTSGKSLSGSSKGGSLKVNLAAVAAAALEEGSSSEPPSPRRSPRLAGIRVDPQWAASAASAAPTDDSWPPPFELSLGARSRSASQMNEAEASIRGLATAAGGMVDSNKSTEA